MSSKRSAAIWEVLGLAVLAGMRTSSAPAIASSLLSQHPSRRLAKGKLKFIQSKTIAKFMALGALSEFIIDKLPSTPDRIKPGGILFRSVAGGFTGACIYQADGRKPIAGAAIGAMVACAATFGSFFLRKAIVKKTKIYDPLIGAIEDTAVAATYICLAEAAAKR